MAFELALSNLNDPIVVFSDSLIYFVDLRTIASVYSQYYSARL